MTWKVTDSMLEDMIENLNEISKCRYQLGHSYGMVHLEQASMECTGISIVSQGNTKKELYYQLQTLFDWLSKEKRSKMDYIKNCTHHDVFNIYMGQFKNGAKHNVSHIQEYERTLGKGKNKKTEKYYECMTCKKELSKDVYDASIVPKSQTQLANMRIDRD